MVWKAWSKDEAVRAQLVAWWTDRVGMSSRGSLLQHRFLASTPSDVGVVYYAQSLDGLREPRKGFGGAGI